MNHNDCDGYDVSTPRVTTLDTVPPNIPRLHILQRHYKYIFIDMNLVTSIITVFLL